MDPLETLRAQLTDDQRALLTAIWDYCQQKNQWIPRQVLHGTFQALGKAGVRNALHQLGGSIVFESREDGKERYKLTALGSLLTDQGQEAERLLIRYLGYIREQYRSNPEIEKVSSQDVESNLGLTPQQSRTLRNLIELGHFYGGGGAGWGAQEWYAGVPDDLDELPSVQDLGRYVRGHVLRGYDPSVPFDEPGRLRYHASRTFVTMGEVLQKQSAANTQDTAGAGEPQTPERSGGQRPRFRLVELWGPLRAALESHLSFSSIKEVVALTGINMSELAHLTQHGKRPASKGALMDGIDGAFGRLSSDRQELFVRVIAEELFRRRPEVRDELDANLRRLGWQFIEGHLLPLELIDHMDLEEVPESARLDLTKAAARFRDGDLPGALTAACSAVDSACTAVYASKSLGDPTKTDSFQERVSRSLRAHGNLEALEANLTGLGWPEEEARQLRRNLEQSLNHAAFVMRNLRNRMSDAHGSKPTLEGVVFDSLKWATIITSLLR